MDGHVHISPSEKRAALRSLLEDAFSEEGLTFAVFERPLTRLVRAGSRLARREVQEAGVDTLRLCEVYWMGPSGQQSVPESLTQASMQTLGGEQEGAVDRFRVVLHVEYDEEAGSFAAWEALLDRIYRTVRQTSALETGDGDLAALSTIQQAAQPPEPRPMDIGGIERAHYCDFDVLISDY